MYMYHVISLEANSVNFTRVRFKFVLLQGFFFFAASMYKAISRKRIWISHRRVSTMWCQWTDINQSCQLYSYTYISMRQWEKLTQMNNLFVPARFECTRFLTETLPICLVQHITHQTRFINLGFINNKLSLIKMSWQLSLIISNYTFDFATGSGDKKRNKRILLPKTNIDLTCLLNYLIMTLCDN